MALTEVQLAKLTIEINKLDKETESLRNKAHTMFLSAAATYGSELAGSSETDYLYDKARELEQKAKFLRSVKNNIIYLSDREVVKSDLEGVERELNRLVDLKRDLELRLKNFEFLNQILSH